MRKGVDSTRDLTPRGQLGEAAMHHVLGYQLAQASIVANDVFEAQVGGPMALRPVEYTVLALIQQNPGGTPAQLAKALAVSAGNITQWVDKLVEKKLVRREASTADRRAQHLFTTPAGEKLALRATAAIVAGEAERLHALSMAERAMLVELLHKVAQCR